MRENLYLESEQQTNGLKALFPTIDVVAQEQVVRFRRETSVFKET